MIDIYSYENVTKLSEIRLKYLHDTTLISSTIQKSYTICMYPRISTDTVHMLKLIIFNQNVLSTREPRHLLESHDSAYEIRYHDKFDETLNQKKIWSDCKITKMMQTSLISCT